MTFVIGKAAPLPNAVLQGQITSAWSEVQRARALQQEAAEAWRVDEAVKQGIRATWFEDRMNATLDALAIRLLPPAPAVPPSFEYPPTA
jgi:hypothetical protein